MLKSHGSVTDLKHGVPGSMNLVHTDRPALVAWFGAACSGVHGLLGL